MIKENLDRALQYTVRPQHVKTPTPKEIAETNANFDLLHRGMPTPKPAAPR
jgi:hypothetical protein